VERLGLISLAILKDELGITDSSQDAKLQRYIDAISLKIEKITGTIASTEYTEKYLGTNTTKLVLKNRPIISVESLKVDDVEIDDYEIEKENGIIHRDGLFRKTSYENVINNSPKGSSNQALLNIEIEYTSGYATVPADIQDIALQETIRRYRGTFEKGEVKSWSLAGASESYAGKTIDENSGLLKENAEYLKNNYGDMVI
jgi:hypothetical protein